MVYRRGPYRYAVEVTKTPRPLPSNATFIASVDRVWRDSPGGPPNAYDPYVRECYGSTEQEAIAEAVRETDEWIQQHQATESNPPTGDER